MQKIFFITDSSFKREILIDWGIIDIFKPSFREVHHFSIDFFSTDNLIELSNSDEKITIAYCLNNFSEKISGTINKLFPHNNINQFNVVFDCFSEKLNKTDFLPQISLLDLLLGDTSPIISKRNIVLINPNGWQKESTNLGLAYISGSLKMFGFKPKIFDLNRYEMSYEQLKDKMTGLNPLLIGYSAKTAVAEESSKLCGYLKKFFPETKMVIGGPHITLCVDEFFKEHRSFDAGCLSESEISMPKLALSYAAKHPIDNIENIAYRKNNEIIINNYSPPENINFPFWPDFDSIDNFSWKGYRYPIVTSRGCPYGCIYCCVNKLTGDRKWRYRDPENVINEIKYVKNKYNLSLFEIWDDNFTFDIDRAEKICQSIIDENLELSWWCHNGIRADRINKTLAGLMKQAGCTSIALGIESGTKEVFDSINKGESIDDILRAVEFIKGAGINVVGYFIIGLPADNLENFIKTIELQRSLKLDHYTFGILIPYPKTKVWDIINEKGKMLMDVTRTQHFAADIVPISFSLPSFPPEDITKAFYLTKYYELFSYLSKQKKTAALCIELHGNDQKHLFGLLVSLPDKVDITAKCFNFNHGFTDYQKKFLQNHCKATIQFPQGCLRESKRFGDVCVISDSLLVRREFIWKKFFVFNSSDPLNLLRSQHKIKEFLKTILIKIKTLLKKFLKKVLKKVQGNFLKKGLKKVFYKTRLPSINRQNITHKVKALNLKIGVKITNYSYRKIKKKLSSKSDSRTQ